MTIRRGFYLAALVLGLGVFAGGCTATVGYSARATVQPRLVQIAPGVWVVEDNQYAVFYHDGAYWRWDGGVWYRSSYVNSGWVRVRASVVPTRVRRIDRPRRYVRYEARGNARVRRVPDRDVRGTTVRGRGRGRGQARGRSDVRRDDGRGRGRGRARGRTEVRRGEHPGRGRGQARGRTDARRDGPPGRGGGRGRGQTDEREDRGRGRAVPHSQGRTGGGANPGRGGGRGRGDANPGGGRGRGDASPSRGGGRGRGGGDDDDSGRGRGRGRGR